MKRIPVASSNLKSVGYDANMQTLEIEFHGGRIYQYFGVPQSIYDKLISASSHGKYFAAKIKKGFGYRKISG